MELDNLINRNRLAPAVAHKVNVSLLEQGYYEFYINILPMIFLATIILWGLYSVPDRSLLWIWYIGVMVLTLARSVIAFAFKHDYRHDKRLSLWRNLFLFSLFLGALSWGSMAFFLWPLADSAQKILCLVTVAGVTAGAVMAISTMRIALFIYLIPVLLQFIIQIFFYSPEHYNLLGIALILYLFYLIILSLRVNATREKMTYLQFENDRLLFSLQKLATQDALTHLDNSLLFHINLTNAIKRAKRSKKLIALFYIDLDNFKSVNDNYGHDIGDLVLTKVAQKIKSILREQDLFARIGGDEFTGILEQIDNRADVILIAKRICEVLAVPMIIDNHIINLSACIGIGFYPDDGDDAKVLIKAADEAMYYVKTHGRNSFHFSSYVPPDNMA